MVFYDIRIFLFCKRGAILQKVNTAAFSQTRRAPPAGGVKRNKKTQGEQKSMFLIVGLGNPGKKYERTRHNVGFMALDALKRVELPNVILVKPQTFVNNSGKAVKSLTKNYKLKTKNLVVIHDDIDIPLGKIKVSVGHGSAGHKGVDSIIEELGTKNFTRIRVGIQPEKGKPRDVETFVLKNFTAKETILLQPAITQALEALTKLLLSS